MLYVYIAKSFKNFNPPTPVDVPVFRSPEVVDGEMLDPQSQADLADEFIRLVRQGKSAVILTKSEEFLLRLRRRIAETSAGDLLPTENPLSSEEVLLTWCEEGGVLTPTPIDEEGRYKSPESMKWFFHAGSLEIQQLAGSQLNIAVTKRGEPKLFPREG